MCDALLLSAKFLFYFGKCLNLLVLEAYCTIAMIHRSWIFLLALLTFVGINYSTLFTTESKLTSYCIHSVLEVSSDILFSIPIVAVLSMSWTVPIVVRQ